MQPTATTAAASARHWTVLSLIEWSTKHLDGLGFDESRLHVELLLARVLDYSRLQLYTNFDRPLTTPELSRFKELFQRRLAHEPLQYILGETEFLGMSMLVTPAVLIPRPETEQLVEFCLATMADIPSATPDVLDIGTGSGNIAIAIAARFPQARVTSIDVSADALALARRNLDRHAIPNVELAGESVFDDFLPGRRFDAIVSNPPYISREEFMTLEPEVRSFEPRIATTDEGDGFRFIRRISGIAAEKLRDGGFLAMEIAYNQSGTGAELLANAGLHEVRVLPDYAGHPRILTGRK